MQVGPYELRRELGRGGMGVVHAAWDSRLGREVALKLIRAADLGDERQRERFLLEARLTARVVHPHVVRLHDVGEADGQLYLVTELLEGRSLQEVVRAEGPLAPRQAVAIACDLAGALDAAHGAGVLHRDVKPHNALLTSEGSIKLLDFGLARGDADRRLTLTGELVGTPAFMPPELAAGERARQGPASDVYGLGATLYFLLAGRPPVEGATAINVLRRVLAGELTPLRTYCPEIDPALQEIVHRCLALDPAARPASARQVGEALRAWLEAPARGQRRTAPRAAAALLILGAGLALIRWVSAPRPAAPVPQPATPSATSPGPPSSARAPASGPLHLDAAALAGLPPWDALEVAWPLGISPAPDGALDLRGPGCTRSELRLPVRLTGDDFSVRARLELTLIEPLTHVKLLLQPRAGQDPGFVFASLGCRGGWTDPARQEQGAELRCTLPGEGPSPRVQPLPLLTNQLPWTLEIAYFARPAPRLQLEVRCGPDQVASARWALPAPLPDGPWWVRIGTNLADELGDGSPPRAALLPASVVRARLLALDLLGLPLDPPREGLAARLGQAARALAQGGGGSAAARELLGAPVGEGPLADEQTYLRWLLADERAATEQAARLYAQPWFHERALADLPALPPPQRRALAEAWRASAWPERDDAWLRQFALHRVWGDKGRFRGPPELADRLGGEDYLMQSDWPRARAYLSEALLAFECVGSPERLAGAQGMAAAWTGDLERALELLRREAQAGNQDAFMHTQWGIVAFRLRDDRTALDAWQVARGKGAVSGFWASLRERLAPLAERRLVR